jgi:hypothetical protein
MLDEIEEVGSKSFYITKDFSENGIEDKCIHLKLETHWTVPICFFQNKQEPNYFDKKKKIIG